MTAAAFNLRPVVALHQSFEVPEETPTVAIARNEVEHRQAGLSRALLATPPDVLRSIAARAARAQATADRWQERVGERPALSPDALDAVVSAKERCEARRAAREQCLDQCAALLTRGSGLALAALAAAGGLVFAGSSPMGLPVAVAVAAAPIAPVVAAWMSARRASAATRDGHAARQEWAAALEATGLPTMGALAARQLAVAAWERRQREAAAAIEGARPHLRAWQRLAGPGVPPSDVDDLVARLELLRHAQLRLLGALLDDRLGTMALTVLAPESEVAEPDAPPSWLEETLNRLRGGKLRRWSA